MTEPVTPTIQTSSPASDVYHTALVRALLFQVFFALLASLMLDGGVFRRGYCIVSVAYWIIGLGVLMVRPGEWGLRYLRYGVLAAFGLTVVISW